MTNLMGLLKTLSSRQEAGYTFLTAKMGRNLLALSLPQAKHQIQSALIRMAWHWTNLVQMTIHDLTKCY